MASFKSWPISASTYATQARVPLILMTEGDYSSTVNSLNFTMPIVLTSDASLSSYYYKIVLFTHPFNSNWTNDGYEIDSSTYCYYRRISGSANLLTASQYKKVIETNGTGTILYDSPWFRSPTISTDEKEFSWVEVNLTDINVPASYFFSGVCVGIICNATANTNSDYDADAFQFIGGEQLSNISGLTSADFYTITYYTEVKDEYNDWPSDVTVSAGETFTVPSAVPYRHYNYSYDYITLNYNYSGSTNTSETITHYTRDSIDKWVDWDTGTQYERGGTYTPTKSMTLQPYSGWWNESWTTGFTLPTPTRSGYTFDGWYSSSTGGTKVGNGGDTYTDTTYSTIYAHWNPNYYTVSYNANGGSNAPSSQSFAYGTEITLGSAATRSSSSTVTTTFSSRGSTYSTKTSTATTTYPFNGWALNSTSGTVYSAGAKYTVTGNVTFYAKWGNGSTTGSQVSFPSNPSNYSTTITNGCSVTLNSNYSGGSNSTKTANLTTTYTFKNWNTNSSGTGTSYTSSSTYKPTSNTTLYAQWNDSSTGTITVTAADAPTRDGYYFIGWSESATGTDIEMEKTLSYTSASSKTLYAQWELNGWEKISIIYYDENLTPLPARQIKYYHSGKWVDISTTKYYTGI